VSTFKVPFQDWKIREVHGEVNAVGKIKVEKLNLGFLI
jgi:hypothetical protein